MLRNIYYALSPQLRLFVRKLVYWPMDLFSPKNNLIPPKGLIYTGRGDFLKAGKYWTNKFIEEGGLLSDDKLLDIGSGIGRMAVGLTSYLKTGEYEGFDAVQQGVDWCQINIQSKFPNFQFYIPPKKTPHPQPSFSQDKNPRLTSRLAGGCRRRTHPSCSRLSTNQARSHCYSLDDPRRSSACPYSWLASFA